MNDERDDRTHGHDAVARAYRELATQRAPATLNERVLRQAAHESGRGYARWSGWLRPLAWAATVGLTLAIVVNLVDVPAPDGDAVTEVYEEETLPGPRAAREPAARARGQARPELAGETSAEPPRASGDAAPASAAFAVDDAPLLEQAADIAAARAGSESKERAAATKTSMREAPACDEAAREQPGTWYGCIERLRADGHAEAAERELGELAQAFPEFEIPETQAR